MSETGSVRWFNNKKGYGFLQKDSDGKDIFVHYSAITMEGYKTLKTNDKVTFDVVTGEKGPQAANVQCSTPSDSPKE
jgi:CspA family cold shock protein